MKIRLRAPSSLAVLAILLHFHQALAVEIEPMGKALAALLGTTKAFKKNLGSEDIAFFSKTSDGKTARVAFIQKGIYAPNCTHTWAVGIDPKTGKVTQIRVIEMSCPHALPTKASSYLDQYSGKGPEDLGRLESQIILIAKATGSSKLATDAVRKSIVSFSKYKRLFE